MNINKNENYIFVKVNKDHEITVQASKAFLTYENGWEIEALPERKIQQSYEVILRNPSSKAILCHSPLSFYTKKDFSKCCRYFIKKFLEFSKIANGPDDMQPVFEYAQCFF